MTSTAEHPDLETLAAFIDGNLSYRERGEVVIHLNECSKCYDFTVSIARAVENEQQEGERSGARRRVVEIRRPGFASISAWRLAAAVGFALLGGWAVFRGYLPHEAHRAYDASMLRISQISSVWLPLDFPTNLESTRGGGSVDAFALCGRPDGPQSTAADRECLDRLRLTRAKFQRVPRWARSTEHSRTLVALDLALGKVHLATSDLPQHWETDCILLMLQRFATAGELRPDILAGIQCKKAEDQASVDLNRALLLAQAGSNDEACDIWNSLPPSTRQSPVGRWHGPRCGG